MNEKNEVCFGCLGEFKKIDHLTVTHPYIGATPACWQMYTELLAKEFSDPDYFKAHRITVDSYCSQHIGDQNDRRSRQSANLHLIALYLIFERQANQNEVLTFLKKTTEIKRDWRDWPAIVQRKKPHWLTVKDIIKAEDAPSHITLVNEWGRSIWNAYADSHEEIISLYRSYKNQ